MESICMLPLKPLLGCIQAIRVWIAYLRHRQAVGLPCCAGQLAHSVAQLADQVNLEGG